MNASILAGFGWTRCTAALVPLLKGDTSGWRKSILIEYYSDKTMPRISHLGNQTLRSERWKYIHYKELQGMDELYDLIKASYEMRSTIAAGRRRARCQVAGGARTSSGNVNVVDPFAANRRFRLRSS